MSFSSSAAERNGRNPTAAELGMRVFRKLSALLAWLAARNVRPPVGLIAAVLLSVFCLISLIFGLFDGDLFNTVASAGLISWDVFWGVVLLSVTAAVGLLPAARASQMYRPR